MIAILLNKPEFEYEIHSLIKAFFPNETAEIYYDCEEEVLEAQKAACEHHDRNEWKRLVRTNPPSGKLDVIFEEDQIDIWLQIEPELLKMVSAETGKDSDREKEMKTARCTIPLVGRDRIDAKNRFGRGLYDLLAEVTGQRLPWGTLVGIRPTKIAMKLLEDGNSPEETAKHLREVYFVSEKKIDLSLEIAERERKILKKIDYKRGYSLYIGIPFCPGTCLYCSFTSYPLAAWKKQVDSYLAALEKEIDYVAERFRDRPLNSIYIGGGTPTTLEPEQLDRLIRKINQSFSLEPCLEFTVEAGRPDSITEEKLLALRENGITRISVNPQTMKQETLAIIGRQHTVQQTIDSFYLARRLGFTDINMDLIMGLPGETLEDVRHTMEVLSELKPDNVTIHSLAVKRAARLNIFKDYYKDMGMVNTQEHMELCENYCRKMGLFPYYLYRQKGMTGNLENVGYAAEGKAGVYNILIMEEKQTILALGAGAVTKLVLPDRNKDGSQRIERVENVKDVKNYLERTGEMIQRKAEKLDELGF